MATLKDLCSVIPQEVLYQQEQYDRQQVMREVARRKAASYQKRLVSLNAEENVFYSCQQRRPVRGKAKNRFSKEEAGTKGAMVMGIRTGKHSVCVCQVKQPY